MKHNRFIAWISVVGLLGVLAISTARADAVEDNVLQGIEELYNSRFDAAASKFDKAIAADRNDPRGYFFKASIHLWKYIFDQQQGQLTQFMNASERAIEVAEANMKRKPNDPVAKTFLGMTYGYRAIAHARAENIMAAALSAKSCYDRLDEVVRADPRQTDAFLGLGIFHFVFGSIPDAAKVVVGIGGIKGDADLGLREINTAARRGKYFRNDAQLIVALLDIYYKQDEKKGIDALAAMSRKYSSNMALLYMLGTAYQENKQPAKSLGYFDKVIAQGNKDFKTFSDISYSRAGMASFMLNKFGQSKIYLQKYLSRSNQKVFRAYCWYLLGVCNEIEGNRSLAEKAYTRAIAGPEFSSPQDEFAVRRARLALKGPLTQVDINIIKALNADDAGSYSEALGLTKGVLAQKGLAAAQEAQAHYAAGLAYLGLKDYKNSIAAFTSATRMGRHAETWINPFSYYYIAQCYLKQGDRKKWQENIEKAKQYAVYNKKAILRFMIERDVTLID